MFDIENYVIVQRSVFTGLKDKNDKKIFEGDYYERFSQRYIVFFVNGCFCSGVNIEDSAPLNWEPYNLDECEEVEFAKTVEVVSQKHHDILIGKLEKETNIANYSDIVNQLRHVDFHYKLKFVIRYVNKHK